jgi:hypothetical protein
MVHRTMDSRIHVHCMPVPVCFVLCVELVVLVFVAEHLVPVPVVARRQPLPDCDCDCGCQVNAPSMPVQYRRHSMTR